MVSPRILKHPKSTRNVPRNSGAPSAKRGSHEGRRTTHFCRNGTSSLRRRKFCAGMDHGPTLSPLHPFSGLRPGMSVSSTPRSSVKAMVRGDAPTRPLLMPLMFALGAKLENLPLRDFRSNPTRIANALRQMFGVLKLDGVTCYLDSYLELKALGCICIEDKQGVEKIEAAPHGTNDLRERLESQGSLATCAPINVACEVVRRLKVMLVDEPALMVVINGPLSLAAQLSEVESTTDSLIELSVVLGAEVALSVSKTFVEAGADVVVLRERWTSAMSLDRIRGWVDSMEPIANLLRFYEVLPVLLLDAPDASGENLAQLANELPNCVLLLLPTDGRAKVPGLSRRLNGIALPVSIFESDQFKRGSL